MIRVGGRWPRLFFGVAVTGIFAWLLLAEFDAKVALRTLADVSLPFLGVALLLLTADYALRVVRWWWMLRLIRPDVHLGICVGPLMASIAINNLVPFRAGDALRVIGFRTDLGSSAMQLLSTLIMERLLDFTTLLLFFFLGLAMVPAEDMSDKLRLIGWLAGISVTGALALLFLPWPERLLHWLAERRAVSRASRAADVLHHGEHLLRALQLLRRPTESWQLMLLSLGIWAFEGGVFAAVAASLGVGGPPMASWFALSTGTLATVLPSTPGYVGTFDYFTMLGMIAFGTKPQQAATFALVVHTLLWLSLTLAGGVYLGAAMLRVGGARESLHPTYGKT